VFVIVLAGTVIVSAVVFFDLLGRDGVGSLIVLTGGVVMSAVIFFDHLGRDGIRSLIVLAGGVIVAGVVLYDLLEYCGDFNLTVLTGAVIVAGVIFYDLLGRDGAIGFLVGVSARAVIVSGVIFAAAGLERLGLPVLRRGSSAAIAIAALGRRGFGFVTTDAHGADYCECRQHTDNLLHSAILYSAVSSVSESGSALSNLPFQLLSNHT
jgi:hypothetical protein